MNGLPINSKLNDAQQFVYDIKEQNLKTLVCLINECRLTFKNPKAIHYCLYVNEQFNVSTLTDRLKRLYHKQIRYALSLERQEKLHCHLMVVIDDPSHTALMCHTILDQLKKIKHVDSVQLNPRLTTGTEKLNFHAIKRYPDFQDCVMRFSYICKENDKVSLPEHYKKTFTTSHINERFYYFKENSNMLFIKQAHKNDKLQYSNNSFINSLYVNCRKQDRETTQCFHFIDNDNDIRGFYGLSIDHEVFESDYVIYLDVIGLYVEPEIKKEQYFESFTDHLIDQVGTALLEVQKNKPSSIAVECVAENHALQSMLVDVVKLVGSELGICSINCYQTLAA